MCGLAGVFGNMTLGDDKIFRELFIGASYRGMHSSGIGFVKKDYDFSYMKVDSPAAEFLTNAEVDQQLDDYKNHHLFMGHARYATAGAVNEKNAHPFLHGDILLAHNGGLRNINALKLDRKFEVDSEAAAYFLSTTSVDNFLEEVEGAFCFTWYDGAANTFNLVRNAERPLYIAKAKFFDTWYYASEKMLLEWILTRNRTQYELIEPTPGELYTCDFSQQKLELQMEKKKLKSYRYNHRGVTVWDSDDEDAYALAGGWQNYGHNHAPTRVAHHTPPVTPAVSSLYKGPTADNPKVVHITDNTKEERLYGDGKRFLKEAGSAFGKEIRFFVTDWRPYNRTSDYGCLIGQFVDPGSYNNVEVIIHGWSKEVLDRPGKRDQVLRKTYKGRIDNCYKLSGTGKYVISVDNALILSQMSHSQYHELIKPDWYNKPAVSTLDVEKLSKQIHGHSVVEEEIKDSKRIKPIMVPGPRGHFIMDKHYLELTKSGCAACNCDLPIEYAEKVQWYQQRDPLCEDCAPVFVDVQGSGMGNQ